MNILELVVAALLGFGGGQAAVLLDRRRKRNDAEADWSVEIIRVDSKHPLMNRSRGYTVTNSGTADAKSVRFSIKSGSIWENAEVDVGRGDSVVVVVDDRGDGKLLIEWTSHRGKSRGPVERYLPHS